MKGKPLPHGEWEKGTSRIKANQKPQLETGHLARGPLSKYCRERVDVTLLTRCISSEQVPQGNSGELWLDCLHAGKHASLPLGFLPARLDGDTSNSEWGKEKGQVFQGNLCSGGRVPKAKCLRSKVLMLQHTRGRKLFLGRKQGLGAGVSFSRVCPASGDTGDMGGGGGSHSLCLMQHQLPRTWGTFTLALKRSV